MAGSQNPPNQLSSVMRADMLPDVAADLLSSVVFLTPAGTRDEGGVIQPAYLNFDAALLGPPACEIKVGGTSAADYVKHMAA